MTPKDPQKPPKVAANLVKGHSVGASSPGAEAKSAVEVAVEDDVEAEAEVDAVENNGLVVDMDGLDADDDPAFRTEAPPLGGNRESSSELELDACRVL